MWNHSPFTQPLSPLGRRMPRRPSVKRRRHVSENQDKHTQYSSKGMPAIFRRSVKCTNCQEKRHNKASCKNPTVAPPPKEKKKMGRPRLDSNLTHWTSTRARGGGNRGGRGSRGGGRGSRGGGRGSRGGGRGTKGGGRGNQAGPSSVEEKEDNTPVVPQPDVLTPCDSPPPVGNDTQDGDGMKHEDKVHIALVIKDLRSSNYSDSDIMTIIGITEDELVECEGYIEDEELTDSDYEPDVHDLYMDVNVGNQASQPVQEGGFEDIVDDEGLLEVEVLDAMEHDHVLDGGEYDQVVDGVEHDQVVDGAAEHDQVLDGGDNDQGLDGVHHDQGPDDVVHDQGLDAVQLDQGTRRRRRNLQPRKRTRRVSERITKLKLRKKVVNKFGIGMSADKALEVD